MFTLNIILCTSLYISDNELRQENQAIQEIKPQNQDLLLDSSWGCVGPSTYIITHCFVTRMSTEAGWELPEIRLVPYAIPALWWQLLPAMLQYGSKKNIDIKLSISNTECISRQLISLCQRLTRLNNHHSTIYSNQDMKSKEVFTDKWLDNHNVVDIYNEIFF